MHSKLHVFGRTLNTRKSNSNVIILGKETNISIAIWTFLVEKKNMKFLLIVMMECKRVFIVL